MAKEERTTYTIHNDSSKGEVKIADEVVAIIAGWQQLKSRVLHPWQEILKMNW